MSDPASGRAMYQGTHIEEPASLFGKRSSAWRVTLAPPGQRTSPDHDATVGMYIVHAPGAHPCWDHYGFSVIHLRPIPGVKPAFLKAVGNTHEFMIVALNPEKPLPSLVATDPGWHLDFLRPIDVVEQFAAANDGVADRVLELAVMAVVDGLASPDQDWRRWWATAIAETASHFRDGTHRVTQS